MIKKIKKKRYMEEKVEINHNIYFSPFFGPR